jgi:predicted amidohydrolase YtcJ
LEKKVKAKGNWRSGYVSCVVMLLALGNPASAQEVADTIYTGGTIITVDDAAPRAESVAVKQGRIIAVGAEADVAQHQGQDTKVHDLKGQALLPGFVDSHGHVIMGGLQALSANLLAPPDGNVVDLASLQKTLRDWVDANSAAVKQAGLIIGFGYDESQLKERRPPTRDDLDSVSSDVPIYVVHQSGHFGVANSAALALSGITASSKSPPGGKIRREEGSQRPNGVLEENAHFLVLGKLMSKVDQEGFKAFARAGSKLWAKYGYTTAQEGRAAPELLSIAKAVAAEGGLLNDVVIYPDILIDRDFIASNVSATYQNGLRVGGAKLTIDGSPQGFTALRDRPYYAPVGVYPPGYKGYAAAEMDKVVDAVDWAYEKNIQLLHSLFPMHTFYWGDWHREHTVGPSNADNISPTGWVRERGMMFGSHHDAPVALPDSMRVLDATVTRRTRSGDILGPAQRVDVMTGIKAMTIWPAWQHFEEKDKGSIEVGKLADFVILSDDPTKIDPEVIDTLEVMVTIKEDKVIYSQSP